MSRQLTWIVVVAITGTLSANAASNDTIDWDWICLPPAGKIGEVKESPIHLVMFAHSRQSEDDITLTFVAIYDADIDSEIAAIAVKKFRGMTFVDPAEQEELHDFDDARLGADYARVTRDISTPVRLRTICLKLPSATDCVIVYLKSGHSIVLTLRGES